MLSGISSELKKVDQLTSQAFLREKVLYPAIDFSSGRGFINPLESKVLKRVVDLGTIKAGDLRTVLPDLKPAQVTYQLGRLIDRGLIQPVEEGARTYTAKFSNSSLIRGVIQVLREQGFIPDL